MEPAAKKGGIIIVTMIFLNQTNGIWVLLNYTNKIFKEAGSSISDNQSSIIVAIVQLIANSVAMICVDLAGRKILIVISCFGASFGYVCMGCYDLFKGSLQAYNWLSLISFSLIIMSASIGMIPLVYILMTEILPKKVSQWRHIALIRKSSNISPFHSYSSETDKKHHKFDWINANVDFIICVGTLLSNVIRSIWHV